MTSAIVDPAFKSLTGAQSCFLIWRVEKLELVSVPREGFGKFFNGDSYIIYSSGERGAPAGVGTKLKNVESGNLEQHIHYWIGENTSQDEAAVAAYKTVELDDYLGGFPIQHMEVQGSESKRFLSYFKKGIRIMQGGVSSGLTHVTNDVTPKLYIIKGRRQPSVRQLPSISWAEMNHGDVFVLDIKDSIFVWIGGDSNRFERLQASKFAQTLKDENGGGNIVFVDDGNERGLPSGEEEKFCEYLPLEGKTQLKPTEAGGKDDTVDVSGRKEIKLYRCSDEDGTLKITEVKTGPLAQTDLKSEDSFIVDNGNHGIWVWVGKRASQKERTEAMRNGNGFVKKKGYSARTQVSRIVDGGEPAEFKSLFKNWKNKDQTVGLGKKYSVNKGIAKVVQTKFDAKTLHEQPAVAAESGMVDDGTGAKEVFRVEQFDLVQVAESDYGRFYSGDCYVILYAYSDGGKDCYLIYYWLGAHSAQDEQGTAALKAIELDDKLGGIPVQVRVVQGKEPPHFMAIFGGKMTIFQGGIASAFDGEDGRTIEVGDTYLLQVHGRSELTTKAVQVPLSAASLNTNDCFVLVSPRETYVWLGKGSTGDEREMAKLLAMQSTKEPDVVYEGQEKSDFWGAIGGKEKYMDEILLKPDGEPEEPRLFHASNASGNFKMEEILNFSQMDLIPEDVMLLDCGETIFVWLGKDSNATEKKGSFDSAKSYLASDPKGRDEDTSIIMVKQGNEPPNFTGFFGAWDHGLWDASESYETMRTRMQQEAGLGQEMNMTSAVNGTADTAIGGSGSSTGMGFGQGYYSYQILRSVEELPADVDPSNKERHLTDDDFEEVFRMSKEQFDSLPKWKQQKLKKDVMLF